MGFQRNEPLTGHFRADIAIYVQACGVWIAVIMELESLLAGRKGFATDAEISRKGVARTTHLRFLMHICVVDSTGVYLVGLANVHMLLGPIGWLVFLFRKTAVRSW